MQTLSAIAVISTGAVPTGRQTPDDLSAAYVRAAAIDEGLILRDWMQKAPPPGKGRHAELKLGDVLVRSKTGRLVAAPIGSEHVGAYPTIDAFLIRPSDRVLPLFLVAVINSVGSIVTTSSKPTVADVAALPIPDLPLDRQSLIADLAEAIARERLLLARRMELAEMAGHERIARALAAATDPPRPTQPEGSDLCPDSPDRNTAPVRNLLNQRKRALDL